MRKLALDNHSNVLSHIHTKDYVVKPNSATKREKGNDLIVDDTFEYFPRTRPSVHDLFDPRDELLDVGVNSWQVLSTTADAPGYEAY